MEGGNFWDQANLLSLTIVVTDIFPLLLAVDKSAHYSLTFPLFGKAAVNASERGNIPF